MKRTILRNNHGQVLAYAVVTLLLVLGMAGLALDGGFYMEGRRRVQTAADAAAMAGAIELWRASTPDVTSAGEAGSSQNGFTNGTNNVTVTVNSPPSSGAYAGQAKFVEAIVSQQRPTMLMPAIGTMIGADLSTMTSSARAVAGPDSSLCIQTLGTSGTGINLSGSASLNAPNCEVVVDSTTVSATAPLNTRDLTLNAESINVAATSATCTGCSPAPQTGVLAPPDPFGNLAPPSFSATCPASCPLNSFVSGTLSPGVYYCGIKIPGGSVTFSPGVYILMGKDGLTISGGATVAGTGVSFYNTGDSTGTCKYGKITISGGSTVSLSAPASPPMQGVLFFQDRNNTQPATISGGLTTLSATGALYFPNAPLTFSGGSNNSGACTVIVASSVNFTGPSALNADCSTFGSAITSAVALAE